ncbi:MAG: LD-carboxypeptidase [Acidobacteriota bacterium]|nr:LD-carboxypeptidase [Acidobacteriota bacterium]
MEQPLQNGVRPHALPRGGRLGVVSLASTADPMDFLQGCAALAALTGWKIENTVTTPDGDFAGTPEARANTLRSLWEREDVDAIISARGGYGCNYLLPLLDFARLREKAKPFLGYSDITALLIALDRAGIVCFHGPMLATDFHNGRADLISLFAALSGQPLGFAYAPASGVRSLVEGEASGTITGGCLSLVVASLGTPWEIETSGKILFLEDVNERPYRIDRMLMQLLQAGKLAGVRGVIFGEMLNCQPQGREEPLEAVILRILAPLGLPVVFGFPSGHVARGNVTLPFGVPARLISTPREVSLVTEAATVMRNLREVE